MTYSIVTSQTFIAWSKHPPVGGAVIESAGSDLEGARAMWREAVKAAPSGMFVRLLADEDDFCIEANI